MQLKLVIAKVSRDHEGCLKLLRICLNESYFFEGRMIVITRVLCKFLLEVLLEDSVTKE